MENNAATWLGLATTLGMGIIGLLTLIVNKRHDEKIQKLETQNAVQANQIETLEGSKEECEEKHKECEEKHNTTELQIANIQRTLADLNSKGKQ